MNTITKGKLFCKAMQTKFGVVFLWVLAIFTVVFIAYMTYAHYTLIQSQEKIKDCYALHVEKADSMYMHLLGYNKDVIISKQKANDAILADSLIKSILSNTQYLSKAQSKKLQFIIENHFSQVEQLHNKYEEKLLRDSLRLCTERELLDGQTKTMIDLHLNKVEHEYSNITIWAAALTILFLVFSFYSIYKMDELIQQGYKGLEDIKKIRKESEKTQGQMEIILGETKIKRTELVESQQSGIVEMFNATEEERKEIFKAKKQEFDNLITQVNDFFEQQKKQNKENK